jgi:cell division protein DivIC
MKSYGKILKNRYFIILSIFLVWMLFFDQDNLMRQYKLSRELNEARERNEYLIDNIRADSALLHRIETDIETKIKIAREEYMMKKDDEEIIVIIDNSRK